MKNQYIGVAVVQVDYTETPELLYAPDIQNFPVRHEHILIKLKAESKDEATEKFHGFLQNYLDQMDHFRAVVTEDYVYPDEKVFDLDADVFADDRRTQSPRTIVRKSGYDQSVFSEEK